MEFDIIIIGGGMVGATLACALGNAPFKVAVIEPNAAPVNWPGDDYDIRVSAITRATENVFRHIGAWEGMVKRRVTPYQGMDVWDATGSGAIEFNAAEIGETNLGHIIENRVILAALLERMAHFENVQLFCPADAKRLDRTHEKVTLMLDDGRVLTAKLLAGTDGARSWVRDQAGITTTGWSYEQTAVVATIKTSLHHHGIAYQRFMPEGPLAFLPMPNGLSSIVWSTTPDRARELVAMEESQFLDELQNSFGEKLGRMEWVGPRGAFPLILKHANSYANGRLVLAGNAAHAIHPLAGQGLNLGVSDVAALTEVLLEAKRERCDIGDLAVLRKYERWRKADNLGVMAAMDGFKRLFSNDSKPLSLLRNVGLSLANKSGPLKHLMVRRAMGIGGDMPKMTQGGC